MKREIWDNIKNSKSFNVNAYRRGLSLLIVSLGLNCILGALIFYVYLVQPERDYYATNGETPPVQLRSMLAENKLTTALLEPDPSSEIDEKSLPQ